MLGVGPYALTVYYLEVKHDKGFLPPCFMKLTASCFILSSTLSELASLCVAQEGVQGNMGHSSRSIDQVISCQRDIHWRKIKQLFSPYAPGLAFL